MPIAMVLTWVWMKEASVAALREIYSDTNRAIN